MNARESALRALYDIEVSGAYTNAALKKALSAEEFSGADKGLLTEIVYGVTANKTALDYIISQYSKLRIKKLSPWVLIILRMGIFQIHYMDKIPHSAACNESVKLAKKYSHSSGAGFVNGVLRSVVRDKDKFEFPKSGDETRDLSLEFSYPEWITNELVREYGLNRTRELYEENQKPHGTFIRINTLKTTCEELIKILKDEGICCEKVDCLSNALLVMGSLNIEASKAYKSGLFSLQNLSSQKTVQVLDPKPDEFVIDMCAAPGGKSCASAERMENKGKILSFDVFDHKVKLIEAAANRLGIEIIEAGLGDATVLNEELIEKADRVLADVPCSGLGVIHKKPDIKWSRKEEDISELSVIQRQILENAAAYVKAGGVLVYSTCTILPQENRQIVDAFLEKHSEYEKVSEEQFLTGAMGESGFYICKMVKGQTI